MPKPAQVKVLLAAEAIVASPGITFDGIKSQAALSGFSAGFAVQALSRSGWIVGTATEGCTLTPRIRDLLAGKKREGS